MFFLATQTVVNTYTNNTVNPPVTYTVIEETESIAASGIPALYPHNSIFFTPAFFKSTTNPVYDYIDQYGGVFVHEAAHVLGLDHTTGAFTNPGETWPGYPSFISPTFGCCSKVECDDVVMESYGCYQCIPHQGCNVPGASDNFMSQNSGCNRYFFTSATSCYAVLSENRSEGIVNNKRLYSSN